jgi:hypothetical protein
VARANARQPLRQWTRVLTLISAREHCNLATMSAAHTRTYRSLMCECTEIKPHDPERRILTACTASAAPMSCEGAQICSRKWRPSCSTRLQVGRARYPDAWWMQACSSVRSPLFSLLPHGRLRPIRSGRLCVSPGARRRSALCCVLSFSFPERGAHCT